MSLVTWGLGAGGGGSSGWATSNMLLIESVSHYNQTLFQPGDIMQVGGFVTFPVDLETAFVELELYKYTATGEELVEVLFEDFVDFEADVQKTIQSMGDVADWVAVASSLGHYVMMTIYHDDIPTGLWYAAYGLGVSSGGSAAPTKPTLTLTDKGDGTGFTAELSGEDAGTTNTLWVGQTDGTFVTKGSTWTAGAIDVAAANGKWYGYVSSSNGQATLTDVEVVIVTGDEDGADDNIPVAVRAMKQTGVYWARTGTDAYGLPTYADPVEIECRWDDVQEEFIASDGSRQLSAAKLIVDRDLVVGGVMMLGDLDDVEDSDDPKANTGAWEIRGWKKTPNFKGTKFLREVYL